MASNTEGLSENETHAVVVMLVDVINHFDFPDGPALLEQFAPIVPRIAELKRKARAQSIPIIYVNDNFGKWRSDARGVLDYCLARGNEVHQLIDRIRPDPEDYFVLKPKHSAFFHTPLDLLLKHLQTKKLVIAGLATNSCILCSANDAYMRDLSLAVPRDCCAARSNSEHEASLEQMSSMLSADVTPSTDTKFKLS